ncbi:hypothetical protein AB6A40_001230 [Gnathostoma spinigerum]|uniref:J domain-containing protein n=1 Tax=Gnathostoma spinigerum TaxID=75299 RepID=A0ABD6E5X5_9BILA
MWLFVFIACLIPSVKAIGLAEGIYCGLENCYDVLSIDRNEFKEKQKDLPRIYRQLVRRYHPDTVKDPAEKEKAVKRFQVIATAYEVLKDDDTRSDYDYYLDHPEERYYNYYQYYRRRVAPKVDVRIVIVVTICLISIFQYISAQQKYQEALSYAFKQEKYRLRAKEVAKQRGINLDDGRGKSKKINKEIAEAVIQSIIEENMDIRGGYKKPSFYDTLLWNIIILPLNLSRYVWWYCAWIIKYNIRKEDYDEEAKLYLIRKKMGLSGSMFNALTEEERAGYLAEELWKEEAYEKWKDKREELEREKLANSGAYKRYIRYMRNQAGNTISFLDE